jgi:hypothetical protein
MWDPSDARPARYSSIFLGVNLVPTDLLRSGVNGPIVSPTLLRDTVCFSATIAQIGVVDPT